MRTRRDKPHRHIVSMGQRVWSKILKANQYETAGSRAAGVLRGHVPWPWERTWIKWESWNWNDPYRRLGAQWPDPDESWRIHENIERLKLELVPKETLRQTEFFAWGPGPRPWFGKPGLSTLNSGILGWDIREVVRDQVLGTGHG